MKAIFIAVLAGMAGLIGLVVLSQQGAGSSESDIEALEVMGVWVFEHESEVGEEALHSGAVDVSGDCLVIDDTVVVWPSSQIDDVARTIEAIQNGESVTLTVAGGGISTAEGTTDLPRAVTERCDVSEVWFASVQ